MIIITQNLFTTVSRSALLILRQKKTKKAFNLHFCAEDIFLKKKTKKEIIKNPFKKINK